MTWADGEGHGGGDAGQGEGADPGQGDRAEAPPAAAGRLVARARAPVAGGGRRGQRDGAVNGRDWAAGHAVWVG